jgi:type IV pilus assembly protein PilV
MSAYRPRHAATQGGVALIEILVAVLLVSFGLLGLISLQSRATQFSVGADDRTRASLLANELASEMWNAGTVNLNAAALEAWNARVADSSGAGLPNGTGTVTPINATTVRITVQWRPPKASTEADNRYMTDVAIP